MEEFFFKNRKQSIHGVCFQKNDKMTNIIYIPVDYVIDGMKFINSDRIENVTGEKKEFKIKVIKFKSKNYFDDLSKTAFRDCENFQKLFTVIQSMDLLCELSLSKEDVVYIGKVINVYDDSINIDFYDTECKLYDNACVMYDDITSISVFTDYLDTLSEVMKEDFFTNRD